MELLKSNLIITENYRPTLDISYMEYFNRALVFFQDNYQDIADRVTKNKFFKITPVFFFEEYIWNIILLGSSYTEATDTYSSIKDNLWLFSSSFRDINYFPTYDVVVNNFQILAPDKIKAINRCAYIINQGIKLFGWETYKDNYLNNIDKLCMLPMIASVEAEKLGQNIGIKELSYPPILALLSEKLGFVSPNFLYVEIQKKVPFSLRLIELILWYSAITFNKDLEVI